MSSRCATAFALTLLLGFGQAATPFYPSSAPAPGPALGRRAGALAGADGLAMAPAAVSKAAAAAPAPAPAADNSGRCLLSFLQSNPDYSTLLKLVQTAPASSGLNDKLQDPNNGLTLFAPDNIAVNRTLTSLGLGLPGLLADPNLVLQILQFHLLPSPVNFTRIKDGDSFNTLLPSTNFAQSLTVTSDGNGQVILTGGKVPSVVRDTKGQKICQDMVFPVKDLLLPPSAVA